MKHGARSEPRVKQLALNKRRTLLRHLGLRQEQLDGIGRAHLKDWSMAAAVAELYFDHLDANGLVDESGEGPGYMKTWLAAVNSSRLCLVKLAEHLKATRTGEPSMIAQLQEYAQRGRVVPIEKGKR